jgi:hypothetical protein
MVVFWVVATFSLVVWAKKALIMKEASTSETSVNFYQTTRHNNPQDSHLHPRRRENLKCHLVTIVLQLFLTFHILLKEYSVADILCVSGK